MDRMKKSLLFSLTKTKRFIELDALRGFIMVLMALDHARTFLCVSNPGYEIWSGFFSRYGSDLAAFITRAVTHLAAPGFFFLMGAGMILFAGIRIESGWTRRQILIHFTKRGGLLILFQFLLENPAWSVGFGMMPMYFGVLFALGTCMLIGSLFLRLPGILLFVAGLSIVVLTEVLLPESREIIHYPLHRRLFLLPGFTKGIWVLYPFFPWLGVTLFGMSFARFYLTCKNSVQTIILTTGFIFISLFFIIRLNEGFGNIRLSSEQTLIGFFNVVKYPPSLAFLLLTLGVNFLILGGFYFIKNRAAPLLKPLAVFGSVPLFFYITHLFLYAVMGKLLGPEKIPLLQMYGFWIIGLAVLIPACFGFACLKRKSNEPSVLRLL